MSADNWGICPKCKAKTEADAEKLIKKSAGSYGKIPVDEWKQLDANAHIEVTHDHNLREDYQIGTDECGEFSVSYSCTCRACGFHFEFKHEFQCFE